jgi:hypothetical protein
LSAKDAQFKNFKKTKMKKKSADTLEFSLITDTNIASVATQLSELCLEVNGYQLAPEYWRWCYLDNPVGENRTVIASRNNRVVGKFGSIHMRLSNGKEQMLGLLLEGLSIIPAERSWSCFSGLLSLSRDTSSAKNDAAFGFAIANSTSATLSPHTGGTNIGSIPLYSGFINVERVLASRRLPRSLAISGRLAQPFVGLKLPKQDSGIEIRSIDVFDDEFNQLWANIEGRRKLTLVKDAAFLNWRYVDCPGREYSRIAAYRHNRLHGYAVFRATPSRRDGFLLELQAMDDDPQTMTTLLAHSVQVMNDKGVGLFSASFNKDSPQTALLKKTGFVSWGTRLWNMELAVVPKAGGKSGPELQHENWSYSLGDWLYYLDPKTWY